MESAAPMRILAAITGFALPSRDGGRLALRLIMRGLAAAGFQLALVAQGLRASRNRDEFIAGLVGDSHAHSPILGAWLSGLRDQQRGRRIAGRDGA